MGELKKIKNKAKEQIKQIKTEHDVIVRFTIGDEKGPLLNLLEDEMEDMYGERKPRKYAGLTVELYAVVEQCLKDIYFLYHGRTYRKRGNEQNSNNGEKRDISDIAAVSTEGLYYS
ncbi:hypothetical protein [Neobacillus bataviensis]|uniref:hypothetical protein n=1 Tax=Neobacillus bataviensis TaxID=220685 RepID=UPI001CBACAC5|nr:hypothetical protein [Neobacillus bataviensis]